VQQGVDRAIREGKRVGRPPFGYLVEDGYLEQKPDEYVRAQKFVREVKKGRQKTATAEFFNVPESAIGSILDRSEKNYGVEFDNSEWRIEREKVRADEKKLEPLGGQDDD
jgi:DNA invertase Pin-like site-specific DNA recombinase